MSPVKARLTVTVDRDLVEAANEAVSTGRASSVSTWVNTALAERVAKGRRLRALASAVAAYEAAFGEIDLGARPLPVPNYRRSDTGAIPSRAIVISHRTPVSTGGVSIT
jgi:hypothetical protein